MVSWDDIFSELRDTYDNLDIKQGVSDASGFLRRFAGEENLRNAVRPGARRTLAQLGDFANATSRVGNNALDFLESIPLSDSVRGAERVADIAKSETRRTLAQLGGAAGGTAGVGNHAIDALANFPISDTKKGLEKTDNIITQQVREILASLGDIMGGASRGGQEILGMLPQSSLSDILDRASSGASKVADFLNQATESTAYINPLMAGQGFLGIGTPVSKQARDAGDEVRSRRIAEELTAMLADQSLASERDSLKEHLDSLLSHKGRKSADSDTFAAKGNDIIRGDGSAMDPSFGRISSRGGEDHTGTVKQFISAGMPEWKANAIVENMGPEAARQLLISQLIRDNSSYYQELINSAVKNSHPNEAFQALAKNLPKVLERLQK